MKKPNAELTGERIMNEDLSQPNFLPYVKTNTTGATGGSESTLNDLLYGGAYNFKHQPERLKYIGKHNCWNQFEKVGEQGVWCELLDSDLHMIEETK